MVSLLAYGRQALIVERIGLPVDREEMHRHRTWSRYCTHPGGKDIMVLLGDLTLPDIGQHGQQLTTILTVLFRQIANDRIKIVPDQGLRDEPLRVLTHLGITLPRYLEFGPGNHATHMVGPGHRRQLEEVT